MLLGGDVVRVDSGDDDVFVHGVVRPDRSEAIFAIATVGAALHLPGPRLRLPGLDAERRYRIRQAVVGTPTGVIAPLWWGEDTAAARAGAPDQPVPPRWVLPGAEFEGVVMSGATLGRLGVSPPLMQPEQVVLLHVSALAL